MLVTTPVALPFALVCKRDLKVTGSSRTYYDEWWNSDGGRHRFVPFDLEAFYRDRVVKIIHMSIENALRIAEMTLHHFYDGC